jgi:outer membrane receptor protein involved in Fe transport
MRFSRRVRVWRGDFAVGLLFAWIAVVLGGGAALGQFGSSVNGTVLDQTGAVVPGATVTLTNTATQQTRTATSSSNGAYAFSELAPGSYTLTATAKGFEAASLTNVAVAAETPRTANLTLTTGTASETVTVNAETVPVMQTSDASIGNTLSSEEIQRLPTNGGDPYELLRTAPGITGDSARSGAGTSVFLPNGVGPGQSNSGIFQTENQVQISAAGQQVAANNYLIDGVSVNSLGQAGAAVVTPNQQSVAQITVLSTSYSAEDGRNSGAQIKVVSKSGTNEVHGSLYFRYDEPGLNAYNHSIQGLGNTLAAAPLRVDNSVRDWAASLGGPIRKNKLFLFTSYEGFKTTNNTYANQFVETPQFDAAVLATRPGSVTSQILGSAGAAPRVVAILTPTCSYYTQAALQNPNVGYQCQIVGNGMDVGSFGPPSNNGTYFPSTSYESGAGLDGIPDLEYAQLLEPSRGRGNQFNGRVDWYATTKDQFAVSAYVTKLDNYGISGSTGSRPQADVPFKPLNTAETFIYIHTFAPTLLNEFRANATRFADNGIQDGAGTVNYGLPYIDVQNIPGGNDVEYGAQQATTTPAILAENTYEVRDAVTKNFGSHTLKFGGEYRWEQDNNNLAGDARPVFSFQALFNFANSAPVYEGIDANPETGGVPNTARYLRSQTLGLFVQHDWRVTPTFTLNTGVRYEYFSPVHNKGMEVNLPVLGPPGNELTEAVLSPHYNFYNPDYTGFSPKFGFAWSPARFDGKMVVRAGVARAMNRLNFSLFDNAVEDGPGYFSFGLCCGSDTSPFAAGQIQYQIGTSTSPFSFTPNPALKATTVNGLPVSTSSTGVTTPIAIEVYGAQPNLRIPYAYLYSLETQFLLPSQFTLTLGFQGSEAHHLPRLVNQNFLYANPANVVFNASYFVQDDSNSNYTGGNVHLTKLFHHGYQMDAVYTYSKSLDQISNGSGADSLANQTNPANNRTEWGPSDYDTRHRITVSGLWSIPGTKGGMKVVNVLTNGWQVNGIYTFHTGYPFTPVQSNVSSNPFVTSAATISPTRPYAYLGGFVSSCANSNYISGNDVKNTKFILAAPTGVPQTPGIGRNAFSGPCYTDTDLSAARQQSFEVLRHTYTLRFQVNFFNAFNQLNLTPFTNGNAGGPALIVGSNPANPTDAAARAASNFGRPTAADAGRQIEFFARLTF